ncbi:MAG: glutathione peroxidase [Phycisphaeraceae bacterium]
MPKFAMMLLAVAMIGLAGCQKQAATASASAAPRNDADSTSASASAAEKRVCACCTAPKDEGEMMTQSPPADTPLTESTMPQPAASASSPTIPAVPPAPPAAPLLAFTMQDIAGQPVDLSQYRGKVVLFVNVASKCGLTPQYGGLEALYEKYKDRGLVVIGVPANNFGGQEPGSNEQILQFCTSKYDVTFPMLGKVSVKGEDTCDLYKALIAASEPMGKSGGETGDVQWNFEKFLLDRQGNLVQRFRPKVKPDDAKVVAAVEAALASEK